MVSLVAQSLSTCQNGHLILQTLVTTGKPATPTPRGVFRVISKASPSVMRNPAYRTWIAQYWIQWVGAGASVADGYGIHPAPWLKQFGPGTDNAKTGSLGCIQVPDPYMGQLYQWVDTSTTVIIY